MHFSSLRNELHTSSGHARVVQGRAQVDAEGFKHLKHQVRPSALALLSPWPVVDVGPNSLLTQSGVKPAGSLRRWTRELFGGATHHELSCGSNVCRVGSSACCDLAELEDEDEEEGERGEGERGGGTRGTVKTGSVSVKALTHSLLLTFKFKVGTSSAQERR